MRTEEAGGAAALGTPFIAVMQGRLLPPVGSHIQSFPGQRWRDELHIASRAGIAGVEWIFDAPSADINPFAKPDGISEILAAVESSGTLVGSVCADYFMTEPLAGASPSELRDRLAVLETVIERCGRLGASHVVLPFVDESSMGPGHVAQITDALLHVQPHADAAGVELHLETDLGPAEFGKCLERLPSPSFKVTYDTGNSASLGYDPREEFASYGHRVGSVHIKDRLRGGRTVTLGTGDTDFAAVFEELSRVRYSGGFVLQTARGVPGEELAHARRDRDLLVRWLDGHEIRLAPRHA